MAPFKPESLAPFDRNIHFHKSGENPTGGRSRIEYALSLDMAKEISMLEGNEKGKQARRYFIECEKRLRQVTSQPLSPLDILKQQVALMEAQEQKINEVKEQVSVLDEKVSQIDARTQTRPDYMTIIGYGSYRGIKVTWNMAVKLGKTAAKLCKSKNYPVGKIMDQRYGYVGSYPTEILKEAFETTIA